MTNEITEALEIANTAARNEKPLDLMQAGTAGTTWHYSDRHPVTVTRASGCSVWVKDDAWKVVSGSEIDGSASYEYSAGNGSERGPFRWNAKRGVFICKGEKLTLGSRSRYYDPHF